MADVTAYARVISANIPPAINPGRITLKTHPSIKIPLNASITYVVGLNAAAVDNQPFKASLGTKVGAINNAGKKKKEAAWAP